MFGFLDDLGVDALAPIPMSSLDAPEQASTSFSFSTALGGFVDKALDYAIEKDRADSKPEATRAPAAGWFNTPSGTVAASSGVQMPALSMGVMAALAVGVVLVVILATRRS